MNVLGYAQKIGQALMVPVAVLPAAAVLMGIGYWLDPDGWGANSQLAAFLIKSGGAIIDNMGLLFAVGVAFGLSKDNQYNSRNFHTSLLLTSIKSTALFFLLQRIIISPIIGDRNKQRTKAQPYPIFLSLPNKAISAETII